MALSIVHNVNEPARDKELDWKRKVYEAKQMLIRDHNKKFQTKKATASTAAPIK